MKKLIALVVVVLFAATFTFAQYAGPQTATTSSVGSNNGAFIEQIGSPNLGTITQTGDYNNANTAYSPSWHVYWDAKGVTQHGSGNVGNIIQHGQSVAGYSPNFAGIGQMTNNNTANITQTQTEATNPWGSITAAVEQKGGDGNTSTQTQKGWYIKSTVWQQGAGNIANVTQKGDKLGYAFSTVDQRGNSNMAVQVQSTNVYYTDYWYAYSTQRGDNNESYQYQYGNGGNSSTITQKVGDNYATTTQTNYGNEWTQPGNTITLDQLSGDNNATVKQTSTGSGCIFTGTQKTGTDNYINLDQTDGVTGGSANIMQNGADNTVQGVNSMVGISHNGSTLNVTQTHDNNTLYLNQNNGATANVNQNGFTNTSQIVQN